MSVQVNQLLVTVFSSSSECVLGNVGGCCASVQASSNSIGIIYLFAAFLHRKKKARTRIFLLVCLYMFPRDPFSFGINCKWWIAVICNIFFVEWEVQTIHTISSFVCGFDCYRICINYSLHWSSSIDFETSKQLSLYCYLALNFFKGNKFFLCCRIRKKIFSSVCVRVSQYWQFASLNFID